MPADGPSRGTRPGVPRNPAVTTEFIAAARRARKTSSSGNGPPGRDVAADLRDHAIPLVLGGRGKAGVPLPLVLDLREQPGGDGVY